MLEHRAAIVSRDALHHRTRPPAAAGDLSAEQSAQFDALKGELESLETRIARQRLLDDAERRMTGQTDRRDRAITASTTNCASSPCARRSARRCPTCATKSTAAASIELSAEIAKRAGRTVPGHRRADADLPIRAPHAVSRPTDRRMPAASNLVATDLRPDLIHRRAAREADRAPPRRARPVAA